MPTNKPNFLTSIVFLVVIAAIVSPQITYAQQVKASLSHYSTDDGLTSNAISHIVQDDYGYIWLATWNGLSRFDGYNFYNYQTGNASGIPRLHNRVIDVAIDNQQNVWMRMYDGRVFAVRRQTDMIINPFDGISGNEEFKTKTPIIVTSGGEVLVSINEVGLYKMRMEKDGVNSQLITTGDLTITSMAEGYQNDIWLGTDKGVHRMDIANLTIEKKGYFLDESITCLFSNGYNIYVGTTSGGIHSFSYGQEPKTIREKGESINALFVDSHGVIWFSDRRQGAIRLLPSTGDEKLFTQRVVVPDYDGKGGVFSENNGTVWVRMNHGGYGYYNRETDDVEYFHNDPSNPWNLSNTVGAALELPEGVVWESTSRRGLDKLEILKNTITRTLLIPEADATVENEIRAMYYDTQRQILLMANKKDQLFLIKQDGSRTSITHDSHGNPILRIYGITKDKSGNYWLCCKGSGLFKMTPSTGGTWDIQNFRHSDDDEYSLSSDNAYTAVEDNDGNIWIATYNGGINVMTTDKTGRKVFLHNNNKMKKYPRNAYLNARTLALGPDGRVWAGTTDGILLMSLDEKKNVVIEKLGNSKKYPKQILMSNDVVYILKDRNSNMWVCTNGGGLSHSIGQDDDGCYLFENYGAKDGLPSEEVKSLTFDNRGNAWFATDHVLCSFDLGKRIFTTFTNLDGVDETMCSEGAALTLPNGNILFGTLNGYYTVDRSKLITTAGSALKLRITDFMLNDQLQSPRLTDNYDYYVPDSRSVTLPQHNAVFAFRFASLNYQLQHRVHYQYMLEGYDHEWKNADKSRTVSYVSLPTGNYTFKVKAFLLESPEKYDMKSIEVVVPPYFLLSSKAIWLYMFLVAAVALGLLFWKENSIAEEEKLRRKNAVTKQHINSADEADYNFVRQQEEWLERNYSDHNQTAEKMAEASGMTAEEFSIKLHQLTGRTPREYVGDFRLDKAMEMLESTTLSIAEIAFNTGFSDAAIFTRSFKQKTGMMPSQYRDQHRAEEDVEEIEAEILAPFDENT